MIEIEGNESSEFSKPVEVSELTLTDISLARQQCEIQYAASPEQVQGMVDALTEAKRIAVSDQELDQDSVKNLVIELGRLIEPEAASKWRNVPVTFSNGDTGEIPDNIDRGMTAWAEAFANGQIEPAVLYYHFEKIHPFVDGNGRVGHCLWAIAEMRQKAVWPQTLPPDVFNADLSDRSRSSFGEVEA